MLLLCALYTGKEAVAHLALLVKVRDGVVSDAVGQKVVQHGFVGPGREERRHRVAGTIEHEERALVLEVEETLRGRRLRFSTPLNQFICLCVQIRRTIKQEPQQKNMKQWTTRCVIVVLR